MSELVNKIRRKLMKMLLQPIRVYCLHHVSETFDESTMCQMDWIQTEVFKATIHNLRKKGYTFISLPEAHEKLKHDFFRIKKYAVLTADDGWRSVKNILPWLKEQQIPLTLFLNPAYLDGQHFRKSNKEKFLTNDDVASLYSDYPLLTIGSHGWEHKDATTMTNEVFRESVERSVEYLKKFPNYIPFYAFTYGHYKGEQMEILYKDGLTPVLVGGRVNYNNFNWIEREVMTNSF